MGDCPRCRVPLVERIQTPFYPQIHGWTERQIGWWCQRCGYTLNMEGEVVWGGEDVR